MKKLFITTFFLFVSIAIINAQATGCDLAKPFCTGSTYRFPAATDVPDAGTESCLGQTPNPAWYYLNIATSGNIVLNISMADASGTGKDVDFICYGPYTSLATACSNQIGDCSFPSNPLSGNTGCDGNVVDCSYSPSATEICGIQNAVAGQWYMLLLTNFKNVPADITFSQGNIGDSGAGSTNCNILNVNPPPVVTVNSTSICEGLSSTLTAVGANTYVWSNGSTANSLTASPSSTTSYTVIGTTAAGSGTAVGTITVNPLPVVTVSTATACAGQSALLSASGANSYVWSNGSTVNLLSISPASTTSYTVTGTTAGCSSSAVGTVIVNPIPIVTVNNATVCAGVSATLTAVGSTTYAWSSGSTTNILPLSPTSTTSYTVTGTTAGCSSSAVGTVIVNPLPVVAVNSASICSGLGSTTLTASGAASYVWSNGEMMASTTISPTNITSYTVMGTSADGCTAIAVGTVTVFQIPGAQFSPSPNPSGMFNPVITFTNQSSSDVNYLNWNFGDGDTLAPNTASPAHTYPSVETTYTVTLIVHNAGFCFDTISHQVVIGPEYAFYIPNAFTPNGDGINDVFLGKGVGIIEYELMIFNRWGLFIFYADDINKAWDGKVNDGAESSQQNVFVWKVRLIDIFMKKHEYIGTVTIVK